MNKLLADASSYESDRQNEKSARNDDDVANKLNKITKKTSVPMKDRTFSGKRPCQLPTFCRISRERVMPAANTIRQPCDFSSNT